MKSAPDPASDRVACGVRCTASTYNHAPTACARSATAGRSGRVPIRLEAPVTATTFVRLVSASSRDSVDSSPVCGSKSTHRTVAEAAAAAITHGRTLPSWSSRVTTISSSGPHSLAIARLMSKVSWVRSCARTRLHRVPHRAGPRALRGPRPPPSRRCPGRRSSRRGCSAARQACSAPPRRPRRVLRPTRPVEERQPALQSWEVGPDLRDVVVTHGASLGTSVQQLSTDRCTTRSARTALHRGSPAARHRSRPAVSRRTTRTGPSAQT